jgi:glycosyltransferase involved in cell wall biosynthesis
MARESILAEAATELRVIPYGIDLTVFRPGDRAEARRALGLAPDGVLVLTVGNAAPTNYYKDFATLERALGRLGQTRDVEVASVGGQWPERAHGRARIRFTGYVSDQHRLADWYRAADLFVHTARADTFPVTILEALASGLPVVATGVGGIPEQIADGRTGLLVGLEDDEGLAAAIASLLDDPQGRARMGAEAASDARARFGVERMVADYSTWFEEILAESRSESSRIRTA